MPHANLKVRFLPTDASDYSVLQSAVQALPAIIAECLNCDDPNGQLIQTDIEVKVETPGPLDIMRYDAELRIEAMDFPSRTADKDKRNQKIMDAFAPLLPPCYRTRHSWLVLANAAFTDKVSMVDRRTPSSSTGF
ncbi:MAG: hypothetical protein WCG99_02210 [Candidatus Berkelbacteria bacterium]